MPAGPMFVRGWAALTALVAATSLLLQYLLLLGGPGGEAGLVAATLRFFGYFTILSNLGVCLGCAWLARGRALGATVAAAMALCIGVTCLVYVLALQALWRPTGLQWWVDMGLHYAVPLLYLGGWLLLLPHGGLRWRALAVVLWLPLAYLGWAMTLAWLLGQAPYPFLEVQRIGAVAFAINVLRVAAVFVLGWTMLWALDRWRRR
ncbi:Pr6Pr family membrane protein [Stenotrophomonas forensis]